MSVSSPSRLYFIDYLRGFLVLVMVADHAVQGYALRFGNSWFFPDSSRETLYDAIHLNNHNFMMPMFFLLAGLFVIPSLQRRGLLNFLKERFLRIVIPFLVGVPLTAPLLSYPRYTYLRGHDISFIDYVRDVYFVSSELQAGVFWFLHYLMAATLVLIIVWKIFPKLVTAIGRFVQWAMEHPYGGILSLYLSCTFVITLSDLLWGGKFWVGFQPIFYVPVAHFMVMAIFFALGAGISQVGLLKDFEWLERMSEKWLLWVILTVVFGFIYISYSINYYYDGAYSYDILIHFYRGGMWADVWPVFFEAAPAIAIRTGIRGFFLIFETLAFVSIFYKFFNTPSRLGQSLAVSAYGIYMLHEPFVIWMHYYFIGQSVPTFVKYVLSAGVGIGVSWFIVYKVLLKLPGFRRVL